MRGLRGRDAAEAVGRRALGAALHRVSGEAGTRASPVTGCVESETASARPRRSGIESPVFSGGRLQSKLAFCRSNLGGGPLAPRPQRLGLSLHTPFPRSVPSLRATTGSFHHGSRVRGLSRVSPTL